MAVTTITIAGVITSALGVIRALISWLAKPRPKPNPKDVAENNVHKARQASAEGNAKDVNARMERYRMRKRMAVVCVAGLALAGGCLSVKDQEQADVVHVIPDVVVVDSSRWQYPMTNDLGVSGWFVPVSVHADFMEAIELVEYYKGKLEKKEGVK